MPLSTVGKVQLGARAALGKKAEDLLILDVQKFSTIGDYFLICSGRSTTQVQSIADAIEEALKAHAVRVSHREGQPESGWVLLDYGDVVVHVFLPETLGFYALDRLWGDAPEVPVDP